MSRHPSVCSRRSVLATAGVAASLGLAGCGTPNTAGGNEDGVEVADPVVESPAIGPWERVDTRIGRYTMERFGVGVTAHERTAIFRNARLERRIRRETLGGVDGRIAMFFATHLDLRGVATIAASPDRLSGMLLPVVEARMEASGIEEVRQIATSSPIPSYPGASTVVEYRGEFRTPELTRGVSVGDAGRRTLEIPADRLPISGLVSVWKPDTGTAFAAGAAFPAGDFRNSDTVSVTGGDGEGIDLTVSIRLDFPVRELRRDVVTMMEHVDTAESG